MNAVAERIDEESRLAVLRKHSLECSECGYGVARSTPPERCPMCQAVDMWAHTPWRPFSRDRLLH